MTTKISDYYSITTDNTSNSAIWVQPQPHNCSWGFNPYKYPGDPLYDQYARKLTQAAAEDAKRELEQLLLKERKKGEKPMRGLYRVYIVDPKTDEVLTTPAFVAKDENSARMKALQRNADKLKHDIDDYNVLTERIGDVSPKQSVQKVQLIDSKD